MIVFDPAAPTRVDLTISLKAGSFVLFLESPSAEERIVDDAIGFEVIKSSGQTHAAAYHARFLRRLGRVVAWEGIQKPDGTAIAFDQATFLKTLDRHPAAIDQVVAALNQLYSTDEAEVKKSDGPPVGSSTAVLSSAASLTGSGSVSDSNNSANGSV